MENLAIRVNNISKTFVINSPSGLLKKFHNDANSINRINALENISFEVNKGEILGIIGLNGSGKSTLLRIISGIYQPDQGSVEINGTLSPLMQLGAGFQGELDAKDNIIMNGLLLGIPKKQMIKMMDKIIDYAELERFSQLKLKHYSTGMRARLAFSIAMQIKPDILLIDEILSVGDKNFQKKSYETFLLFKQNNKTVLHASHNISKLEEFSDRILLLNKGKLVMIGKTTEVLAKYKEIKSTKL